MFFTVEITLISVQCASLVNILSRIKLTDSFNSTVSQRMTKLFSYFVTINILHKFVRNVKYHLRKKKLHTVYSARSHCNSAASVVALGRKRLRTVFNVLNRFKKSQKPHTYSRIPLECESTII